MVLLINLLDDPAHLAALRERIALRGMSHAIQLSG